MQGLKLLKESSAYKKVAAKESVICTDIFDESASAMYILLSGKIGAYSFISHKETNLEKTILPSGFFGARDFFTGNCDMQYIARELSGVYAVTKNSFAELAEYFPELIFEIYNAASAEPQPESRDSLIALARENPDAAFDMLKSAYIGAQAGGCVGDVSETSFAAAEFEKSETPTTDNNNEDLSSLPADPQQSGSTYISQDSGIFPPNHKSYPGVTHPEFKKLTYIKEFKCIYCKKLFKTDKVFLSKLYESAPARFDMRKFYKAFKLEWYEIYTCPHCYYSTLASYYEDPRAVMNTVIEDKLIEAKDSLFLDFEAERDLDFVITQHYLTLLCAPANIPRKRQIAAKMWANLSWLYEDIEDKEMEMFACANAAKAYEAIYSEDRLTPAQEQVVCMTIAGMLYRAKIEENLKKYLLKVKSTREGKKVYVEMAENLQDALGQDKSEQEE